MAQRIPRLESLAMIGDFHSVPVRSTGGRWGELLSWLSEPSRPGQWTFALAEEGEKVFCFTDENVAMEFRLRWG